MRGKVQLSQQQLTQTIATIQSKRTQAVRRELWRLAEKYDEKIAQLEAQLIE